MLSWAAKTESGQGMARVRKVRDMKTKAARVVLLILAVLLGAEVVARLSGIVDFPVYHVDDGIGYIPQPNQAGSFLHRNSWVFNDRSMGTASSWSAARPNILLIGNSIVMGGNPYDQKDKLGPLIQQKVGDAYAVWPIAAGGWSNVNEMAYLKRNPDVTANSRFFVWEFMSGGLSGPSIWRGDLLWPREHPAWASWYVFERYVWPRLHHGVPSELPPVGAIDPSYLAQFRASAASLGHRGILFLYPDRPQYLAAREGQEWLPERAEIERIASASDLAIIDIAHAGEWSESLYKPDGVHPTVAGNEVLAKILAAAIKQALGQPSP
jgi:hypothetical protein